MPAEARLTIRAVHAVIAGLRQLGHDTDALMRRCAIGDSGVPHGAMMRLWDAAAETANDPDIGMHVAEAVPIATFEMHGYAFVSSRTLREAYRRGVRYQRLIHESTSLTFDERSDPATLRHALPGGAAVPRHPAEFLATTWVRLGRIVAGVPWVPRRVLFAHERPRTTAEHARIFGILPEFGSGVTAIEIPGDILDKENARADPTLAELMDRYADTLLRVAPSAATTADRVLTWLTANLQNGTPVARSAATALGISQRSLQRALARESTSFAAIIDRYRHERAVALLRDSDCTIGEVAYLLGFSEVSAFHRAFRRWTGVAPSAFRAER